MCDLDTMSLGLWTFLWGLLSGLYFFPSLVADRRAHRQAVPIFLTNVFLGWTGLGWLVALHWATTRPAAPPSPPGR
jgi:hypothetical protein